MKSKVLTSNPLYLEKYLNDWLAENPDIEIVKMGVSETVSGSYTSTTVVILYYELKELRKRKLQKIENDGT